jgi:hypothetical protein
VGWVEGLARVEGARSYAATHRAALMMAYRNARPRPRTTRQGRLADKHNGVKEVGSCALRCKR